MMLPVAPHSPRLHVAARVLVGFLTLLAGGCGGGGGNGGTTSPAPAAQLSMLASTGATLEWIDGTHYRLTLTAPHDAVGTFGGTPLRRVTTEPLRAWVDAWADNGLAAQPPTALFSAAAGAQPGIGIVELSNPALADSGALQFEARIADAAGRSSPWFPAATFSGVQLLVDQTPPIGAEDRGLLTLSATAATLQPTGGARYLLQIDAPSALMGFAHDPLRRALSETATAWAREWTVRGFDEDPPAAALAFSTDAGAPATELALIELRAPVVSDSGAVQLEVRLLGRPGGAALPTGAARDLQLVVGDAPLLATSGCRTDADCSGTATCDADASCQPQTCTGDGDCDASEMCDLGHCLTIKTCDTTAACGAAQSCDGTHCRLKPCATTADCDGSESCRNGVCAPGGLGASPMAEAAAHDAFWGATWAAPKVASACASPPQTTDAAGALCQQFETAAEDRVRNLVAMLSQQGDQWSYYGKFAFFGVNETAPIPDAFKAQYVAPSAPMQSSLLGHFAIFDTAYINYSTRLGVPLIGSDVLAPFASPLPDSPLAFVQPFYDDLRNDTPDDFPTSFITSLDPFALAKQFGGGGGFGCYIGTIDRVTQILSPPAIQFGGGFGFGLSESRGLDLGFGGGINLCTADSVTACVEDPVNFFGGGGGVNFDFPSSTATPDQDTDGNQGTFNATLQTQFADQLLNADQLYLSCGHGGGVGFQSLPANQGPAVPPVYQQTFGVGGGGWSFAVLTRSEPGTDVSDVNLLTGLNAATFSALYGQFVRLLNEGDGPAPAGNPALAQRGLYDDGGMKRYEGPLETLRFVYEPYQFPIANPSQATADTVYIPGSNSPAALFFSSGGADLVTADAARMTADRIAGVLYTINVNPADVQYRTGVPQVRDINDTVLAALDAASVRVTLAIPLAIQHDADGVSQQAPIISANKEILDYAVAALAAHQNIDGIVVGTGEHGVIKGFFPSCNGFNYTTAVGCADYATALTFEDYFFLLKYLIEQIGDATRPVTVGILQSQENWFANSTISNSTSDPTTMQLIGYWGLPSSTQDTGLKHFITALQPASTVTLEPMFGVDLVAEYPDQPLADALNGLQAVLSRIKQNVASATVVTGWYGAEIGSFLASAVVTGIPGLGFDLIVDEMVDQPWRALPSGPGGLPGMPDTPCGHVYPIPALDKQDPQGPPLMQDLPPQCGPDFSKVPPGGGQPQPQCLCLTNSTDYPATFMPFLSNLTTAAESPPTLVVPARRAVTYEKTAPSFYSIAVDGKDGAYSLGVTWQQWPYSQTWANTPPAPQAGDPVPAPTSGQAIPSLVCVGVSDAQNGAANANAGSPCDQVWYQTFSPSGASEAECVTLTWTAKGTGWRDETGWELQTLEAPPPNPGESPQTYAQAPLVVIPQQDQQYDDANFEVSSQYTYCGNDAFPHGLSPGQYQFRVQPIGGIPSVDAIDIEFPVITVTSGATDWQTLGQFSVDYPLSPDGLSSPIESIVFTLPPPLAQCGQQTASQSFTLTAPLDNGISDISLPGQPQGNSASADDACYTTTLTVNFAQPVPVSSGPPITACSVALVITSGMDEGDQDGEAVRAAGPIDVGRPEQACFLELQNDLKTVNGSSFQFKLPTPAPTP